jgi:hypothetical protein
MIQTICRISGYGFLIAALLLTLPLVSGAGGASSGASAFATNPILGDRVTELRMEIAKGEAERARWEQIDDALAKVTLTLLVVKATAEATSALGFTFVGLIQPEAAPFAGYMATREVQSLATTLATLMDELDK